MFAKKETILGSDHPIHVSIINRIKANKHRFLTDYVLAINEKHVCYPQLFHWILSLFPERLNTKNFVIINISVKVLEIIAFNLFLIFLFKTIHFDSICFLYSNIIINVFPFSYAIWNAKNTGLSARGIGLVVGQIYTYLIVVYVITSSQWLLVALLVVVFTSMLISQMAMQYILLSSFFMILFLKIPEILLLPIISFLFFFMMMPNLAKNYAIGQFNHKRNYALFDAEPSVLKYRPSIYRDFIYDFWIKLNANFKTGIVYIYKNPLVEIIYGIPFLWLVIYINAKYKFEGELQVLFYTTVSALCVFFFTSFRWTRFLGEPQRYLEFVFPLITILYVLNFGVVFHLVVITFCIGAIFSSSFVLNRHKATKNSNISRIEFVNFIANNNHYHGKICISNDNEIVKFITGDGIKVLRPDSTIYIKDKKEYYENYINNDLYIISPAALAEYYKTYSIDILVLNTDLYSLEALLEIFKPVKIEFVKRVGSYELYQL